MKRNLTSWQKILSLAAVAGLLAGLAGCTRDRGRTGEQPGTTESPAPGDAAGTSGGSAGTTSGSGSS